MIILGKIFSCVSEVSLRNMSRQDNRVFMQAPSSGDHMYIYQNQI